MGNLFNKQYRFKGRHAKRVEILTSVFDPLNGTKLFKRNIDVYINAPIIGFLYGRQADLDEEINPEREQVYNENVMGDRVMSSSDELTFNFQLIMLLDERYEADKEKRINKAFRHVGEDPADEEHFNRYVRGGIDVLYENLIEDTKNANDMILKLSEFLEKFQERFNSDISNEDILTQCLD